VFNNDFQETGQHESGSSSSLTTQER